MRNKLRATLYVIVQIVKVCVFKMYYLIVYRRIYMYVLDNEKKKVFKRVKIIYCLQLITNKTDTILKFTTKIN